MIQFAQKFLLEIDLRKYVCLCQTTFTRIANI